MDHTVVVLAAGRLEVRNLGDSFAAATGQVEERAWAAADAVGVEEDHDAVDCVDHVGYSAIVDHHNHLQQEDQVAAQGLEDLCMEQTADH